MKTHPMYVSDIPFHPDYTQIVILPEVYLIDGGDDAVSSALNNLLAIGYSGLVYDYHPRLNIKNARESNVLLLSPRGGTDCLDSVIENLLNQQIPLERIAVTTID